MVKEIELEDLINDYEKYGNNKLLVVYGSNSIREQHYILKHYDTCLRSTFQPKGDGFYSIDTDKIEIIKNDCIADYKDKKL